jgi:hypothetical protein
MFFKFQLWGATLTDALSVILQIGGYTSIIFYGFMMIFWFYVPILYTILLCLTSALIIYGITNALNWLSNYLKKTSEPKINI